VRLPDFSFGRALWRGGLPIRRLQVGGEALKV